MAPAFNGPAINDLHSTFKAKADELCDRWEAECLRIGGDTCPSASEDIGMATVNVIGEAACGYEVDAFKSGLDNPLLRSFAIISCASTMSYDTVEVLSSHSSTVGSRTAAQVLLENGVDSLPPSVFRAVVALPTYSCKMIADAIATLNEISDTLFRRALDDVDAADKKRDLLSVLGASLSLL